MQDNVQRTSFRDVLDGQKFCYGAEVVTTRGLPNPETPAKLKSVAETLLGDERIGWISITDSPGGSPMLPPDWLANRISHEKNRIVLHVTCKDMNRNALEGAAWRFAAEGYENILAITGDYPAGGFGGVAEPVFDLDSVGLIAMLKALNDGLEIPGRGGKTQMLEKTDFFIGAAVSPFKRYERELMPQYFKMARKIQSGAQWIIPQLGYDMRKFREILLLLENKDLQVPVIGNVYLLNKTVAGMFNRAQLPGCVVSDTFMEQIKKNASGDDRGRGYFAELAAKQLAVFKGLGFAAGYLGGIAKPETFGKIIDLAETFGEDDWKDFYQELQFSQPDEFFLFDHAGETDLSKSPGLNPEYVHSLEHPRRSREVTLSYRFSRLVHDWFFSKGKGFYGMAKGFFSRYDTEETLLGRAAYAVERNAKAIGFGCADCGDCSLPECAYLCPNASCSKGSRNGPCGGSTDGRCELDDKECLWTRAYDRLKYFGETDQLEDRPVVINDATLKHTSSWANIYLDRDHSAQAEEKQPAEKDNKQPPKPEKGKEADGN